MKKNTVKLGNSLIPRGYAEVLEQLKKDIQQTQLRAALAVTKELTLLYWRIGTLLSKKIINDKWGTKPIDRLANDLQSSFQDISGFSVRNLQYMRKFAESYQDANCAAVAAQLPWGHNMVILDRIANHSQRLWYIQQTIENGWS